MVEVVTIKKRDIAVDFVKVIATLLVLNSHMGICYGSHSALATGGGIGDALFFFISGFTLFMGRKMVSSQKMAIDCNLYLRCEQKF